MFLSFILCLVLISLILLSPIWFISSTVVLILCIILNDLAERDLADSFVKNALISSLKISSVYHL